MKLRIVEISELESGVFSCKAEECLPCDILGRSIWFNTRKEKQVGEELDVPEGRFDVVDKVTKKQHIIHCLVAKGYKQPVQQESDVEEEQ